MWPGDGDPAVDEDSLPSIEALTIEPERSPADVPAEVNHLLGIGARRVRHRPDGPDVSELRERMGL